MNEMKKTTAVVMQYGFKNGFKNVFKLWFCIKMPHFATETFSHCSEEPSMILPVIIMVWLQKRQLKYGYCIWLLMT